MIVPTRLTVHFTTTLDVHGLPEIVLNFAAAEVGVDGTLHGLGTVNHVVNRNRNYVERDPETGATTGNHVKGDRLLAALRGLFQVAFDHT